jgi:15-cis-phytoene synthase
MCVLMRVRDADALARACDLGLAMQLTNIARDLGEDAREGRLYLPQDWLDDEGMTADDFLALRQSDPRAKRLAARLLARADAFYLRSEAGVPALPLACRPGIYAARHVYAGIGGALARLDHDSITQRARTRGRQKLGWLGLSLVRAGVSVVLPGPAVLHAPCQPELRFLVDAAARNRTSFSRSEALFGALAQLERQDRAMKSMGQGLDRAGV